LNQKTQLKPPFEEFASRFRSGTLVPVYAELAADYETPLSAYQKITGDGGYAFLLESAEKTENAGRYSFLGASPRAVFEARGKIVKVTEGDSVREFEAERDPLAELEVFMGRYKPAPDPGLPAFYGGAVGYLGYDCVRYFERAVPEPPDDGLGLPDMVFSVTDEVLIFDHRFRIIQVVANVFTEEFSDAESAYAAARERIDDLIAKLEKPLCVRPMRAIGDADADAEFRSNTTREEYLAMVEKVKDYIHAGDVFQAVPSQRFEMDYGGTPADLYRALRHVNPSPYMFLLQFPGDFALVGSSPEVHVRCIDEKVEIRPIAGTRWRGETEEEDRALAGDLLSDPKERAEHIMLVDLARNDVGRAADFGTVEVDDLMIIERYSHVMHIVSNVKGRLAAGRTAYDVMRATFPAGTVSGSPKIRAMQIINDLEKSKRGAYAGAVGYFGFDGDHDSCIALRTCVVKGDKVYIQAGAGVVADSAAESEYEETCNKARGMLRAVERARRLADD